MSFKPIPLKNGKSIALLSEARGMIDRLGNHRRSELHWVNAIAEFNSVIADPKREAIARKALYEALAADNLAV
jgi:hypothetical protein